MQLMAEEAGLRVDKDAFDALMKEEQDKSRADRSGGGAAGLKFEAEATAALQSKGVKCTDDSPKCAVDQRGIARCCCCTVP